MPDTLTILAVDPLRPASEERGWPEVGDDLHTYETLLAVLEGLRSDVRVVFSCSWVDAAFGAFVRSGTTIEEHWADRPLVLQGGAAVPTEVTSGPLVLSCEGDRYVDALIEAAGSDLDVHAHNHEVWPPRVVDDPRPLLTVLQFMAPTLVRRQQHVVMVGSSYAQLTVDPMLGARIDPLVFGFEDERCSELLREALPRARVPAGWWPPLEGPAAAVKRDELIAQGNRLGELLAEGQQGGSPLTRGSAKARVDAAWNDEVTLDQLLEAVTAPENEGRRFERARITMYERLSKRFPHAAVKSLLAALRSEPPRLLPQLYELLSWLDDPAAARALFEAFVSGAPGPARDKLGASIWRQRSGVELVARRLADAWASDPPLSRRLFALVKDEYLTIQPEWVAGAPAELKTALSPFLARAG